MQKKIHKMKTTEEVLKFLSDRPLIKINQLEKMAQIPKSTLSKALNDRMALPPKHLEKLISVLSYYGLTDDRV